MKRFFRLFLLTLLVCAPLSLFAQSGARYGYLNRAAVIALLPETARVRAQLDSLRAKYEAEARYNETAFRRQYSEYLQVQKICPRPSCSNVRGICKWPWNVASLSAVKPKICSRKPKQNSWGASANRWIL